ncbi:GPN-loop GTPase 1 [Porphyridium purpureum]|uniref:GPN-loop GTPase 1 n=1 Tax=Porphyridium purpureum TaxID=35688 RepID=A0A5J4Z5T0_PORPP|nr:GPN-loop GTPase 1 [Porphyridium purpureum]|eukprot:POR2054..scf295_1
MSRRTVEPDKPEIPILNNCLTFVFARVVVAARATGRRVAAASFSVASQRKMAEHAATRVHDGAAESPESKQALGDGEDPGQGAGGTQPHDEEQDSALSTATVCLVIGMAGSGKSTFVQQFALHEEDAARESPYLVNLDPAVASDIPGVNLDIRDTVKYKEVMEKYKLGPNGAILTCLNLFCTKIDQVLNLVEARAKDQQVTQEELAPAYVVVDTPGQIEAFTWSASGTVITESFASSFPTVVLYVVDIPRCCENALTFSSNMLHACSIMYKMKLPMVIVFNKCDVQSASKPLGWMRDYEQFDTAISESSTYVASFARSMALVLHEFYKNIDTVELSAMTGDGFDELTEAIDRATTQYYDTYVPMLEASRKARQEAEAARREHDLAKALRDISVEEQAEKGKARERKDGDHHLQGHIRLEQEDDPAEEERLLEELKAALVLKQRSSGGASSLGK